MIIWLTGLSGSGKTTVGSHVYDLWKADTPNVVLVDGDHVRRLLGADDSTRDYTMAGRRKVAQRIADICSWLDEQNIHVVCCTISLFEDLQKENRERFNDYFEVYLSVPMDILRRRDNKNLYAPAFRNEIKDVIGVDLPFKPPAHPHMTIDNSQDSRDLALTAREILETAQGARKDKS